jgi:hypothetical protein
MTRVFSRNTVAFKIKPADSKMMVLLKKKFSARADCQFFIHRS